MNFRFPSLAPVGPGYGYRIGAGDELALVFPFEPTLNQPSVLVRPDGMITAPLVQDVRAGGLTTAELDTLLIQNYSRQLRYPVVNVSITRLANNQAYVMGEVGVPTAFDLGAGLTVLQIIAKAGGFKPSAAEGSVVILHRGEGNRVFARKVDVRRIMDGDPDSPDILLAPTDIVYVPRKFIARLDAWVNEYITLFLGELTTTYLKGWEIVQPSRFFVGSTNASPATSRAAPGTKVGP